MVSLDRRHAASLMCAGDCPWPSRHKIMCVGEQANSVCSSDYVTSAPKQQHAECSFVCSAHTAAGDLCDSGPGPITASRRDGQRLKPLWFWLHRRVHLIFRSVVLYRSCGSPWFLRGRRRPRYGETREVSQRWPRLCKTCRPFFLFLVSWTECCRRLAVPLNISAHRPGGGHVGGGEYLTINFDPHKFVPFSGNLRPVFVIVRLRLWW